MKVRRSANNLLGLLLLPLLAFGVATGFAIWAVAGLGALVPITLVALHAYSGLVSLPVLALKAWAGMSALRQRAAKEGLRASPGRTALTFALLACVLVLYGSGILMYANLTPGGNAFYKQAHLWSAVVAAPLVTHHLYLYLGRALEAVGRTAGAPREVTGGRGISRAGLLRLGALALVAVAGVRAGRGVLESVGSEDPNDFPVTLTSGGSDRPDPEEWRLLVSGGVEQALEFSLSDLRGASLARSAYSLDCVIGWSVVREWGGVPVMDVISEARPRGEVVSAVFRSTTGYEVALPLETLRDPGTMVTLEVGGVPLSPEHGFPARLMAPGVIGEKCVKWLAEIEVVTRG